MIKKKGRLIRHSLSFPYTSFSLLKDKHTIITLCLGQFLSLMISSSAISSEMLIKSYGLECPGLQIFFSYFLLFLFFFPYFFYSVITKKGKWNDVSNKGPLLFNMNTKNIIPTLPLYILGSLFDYEANFLVVTSLAFISILNMTLILCLTTPVVMILSILLFKVKYKLFHYIGVCVALLGIGAIIFVPEAQSDLNASGKWLLHT